MCDHVPLYWLTDLTSSSSNQDNFALAFGGNAFSTAVFPGGRRISKATGLCTLVREHVCAHALYGDISSLLQHSII